MKTVDQVHFNKVCLPFWVLAAACLVPAVAGNEAFMWVAFLSVAAASSLTYLRVTDEIDELWAHFGPMPLLGVAIPYNLVESAEVTERVPFAGVPMLIPGVVGVFAARRGPGVRICLKKRFAVRLTGLLLARVYIVQAESPDEVATFIRQRIGELKHGYDYGVEFRPGCGVQMLVIGIVVAALIAFGLTDVAIICFLLALPWPVLGMWLVGGVRTWGFSDSLFIRHYRGFATRIAYSEMDSIHRPWMSSFNGREAFRTAIFFQVGAPWQKAVLIRLKEPARLRRHSLRKVSQIIVGTKDPDGLYEFLRSKLPAERAQE